MELSGFRSPSDDVPRRPRIASRAAGEHYLVDLYGVAAARLTQSDWLLNSMLAALQNHGFHIVDHRCHRFPGPHGGATAVVLLSESHATFHTYPEYEYLAMDVFSCGAADSAGMIEQLVAQLEPRHVEIHRQPRGERAEPATKSWTSERRHDDSAADTAAGPPGATSSTRSALRRSWRPE